MRLPFIITVCLGVLLSGSCSSDEERAAGTMVKEFRELADSGQLEKIRRAFNPSQSDWDDYMEDRRTLGRLLRSTLAFSDDATGYSRQITLVYNSEFEQGHAVEQFFFKIEENGPRLLTYMYLPGKQSRCYMIGSCELIDPPQ